MSTRTRRIARVGAVAGYVVAAAGATGLLATGLARGGGGPLGALGDLALLVMAAAIAPLMLSFYELGGATPLRLAQAAQALGWVAVATWCGVQILLLVGGAGVSSGAYAAVFSLGILALGYIGLWIAGANALAGPWLSGIRWVGLVAGLGIATLSLGLLGGGASLAYLGAVGFQVVLPFWAYLMARLLAQVAAS